MRAVIDNIMTFHEMRGKALSVLVDISERALEESAAGAKRKTEEPVERVDDFARHLIIAVGDMVTRFWFQKERRERDGEQMTDEQAKNVADFVSFVKTLTNDVRSLLTRFQEGRGRRFEKKFEKEVRQMETNLRKRLKEFDEALDRMNQIRKGRLSKYVCNAPDRIGESMSRVPSGGLSTNVANSSSEE